MRIIELLELKRLGDHHLEADALFGVGRIDADHDTLGPGADTETGAPFHVRVQI